MGAMLEDAGIKLGVVATDIFGVSGLMAPGVHGSGTVLLIDSCRSCGERDAFADSLNYRCRSIRWTSSRPPRTWPPGPASAPTARLRRRKHPTGAPRSQQMAAPRAGRGRHRRRPYPHPPRRPLPAAGRPQRPQPRQTRRRPQHPHRHLAHDHDWHAAPRPRRGALHPPHQHRPAPSTTDLPTRTTRLHRHPHRQNRRSLTADKQHRSTCSSHHTRAPASALPLARLIGIFDPDVIEIGFTAASESRRAGEGRTGIAEPCTPLAVLPARRRSARRRTRA